MKHTHPIKVAILPYCQARRHFCPTATAEAKVVAA